MILRNIIIASVALSVAAAAGMLAFFAFFQSDEALVGKQLNVIAELVSKDSDEHELTAAVTARKIAGLFADDCWIEIPAHNISKTYAKQELSPRVLSARYRYSEILLQFNDVEIGFPDNQTARVVCTALVEALWTGGGGIREDYEIVCRFKKIENQWLFSHVKARLRS